MVAAAGEFGAVAGPAKPESAVYLAESDQLDQPVVCAVGGESLRLVPTESTGLTHGQKSGARSCPGPDETATSGSGHSLVEPVAV